MYRDIPYNFGAIPMPAGYSVVFHDCHEHYQGHGPDDWDTAITCDPYQARRWCVSEAAKQRRKENPVMYLATETGAKILPADHEERQKVLKTGNSSATAGAPLVPGKKETQL